MQNKEMDKRYFYQNKILEKLCDHYTAVYLLVPKEDKMFEFKQKEGGSFENGKQVNNLYEFFCYWVENNVAPDYKYIFADYLGTSEKIKKIMDFKEEKKFVFHSLSDCWFELAIKPFEDDSEQFSDAYLVTVREVNDLKNGFQEIYESSRKSMMIAENYVRLFIDAAKDTFYSILKIVFSKDEVIFINIDEDNNIEETHCSDLNAVHKEFLDKVHPDYKEMFAEKSNPENLAKMPAGSSLSLTYLSKTKDDIYHWFSAKIIMSNENERQVSIKGFDGQKKSFNSLNADGKVATVFIEDINDEIQEKKKLLVQSEHDKLTGLFNRTKLDTMKRTEYANLDSCGVLFFDVNNLKVANDKFGHEAGDDLLGIAADSIRSLQNRRIHAYRYGGDEFIVIVINGDEEEIASIYRTWQERLKSLSEETGISCSVAVGSAWCESPSDLDSLIHQADNRMYVNKKKLKEIQG